VNPVDDLDDYDDDLDGYDVTPSGLICVQCGYTLALPQTRARTESRPQEEL